MEITTPEVNYPEGTPPKALEITDIWEGDGKVAGAGDTVEVHYVGVAYSTGEEFDASWNRGGRVGREWERGGAAALPTWCRAGHPGLGPGRAGDEGGRPPQAGHSARP